MSLRSKTIKPKPKPKTIASEESKSIEEARKIIYGVIGSKNLDNVQKALQFKKFVSEEIISKKEALLILSEKNEYSEVFNFFLLEDYSNIIEKKPLSQSASNWGINEKSYYNIVICPIKDPTHLIEEKFLKMPLFENASKFLEKNKNFSEKDCTEIITEVYSEMNSFQRKCINYFQDQRLEARTDGAILKYLEEITNEKYFSIELQIPFDLLIGKLTKVAKPDLVFVYSIKVLYGPIVIEDKNVMITKEEREEAEMQLIAEAIAIAQQDKWPKNIPIYILRCIGLYISIYRAHFDENFLFSVENGLQVMKPTEVLKYAPKNRSVEGLYLLNPKDRALLTQILNGIENYYIEDLA